MMITTNQFLGSTVARSFDECLEFIRTFNTTEAKIRHDEYGKKLNLYLKGMHRFIGNLAADLTKEGSGELLFNNDFQMFRKYMYYAGKLSVMGNKNIPWAYGGYNVDHFFHILMSDCLDLVNYLITHKEEIAYFSEFRRGEIYAYLNANTLLALSGD